METLAEMKGLIIHIGPHKTGTTSLQKTLVENRPLLASHGYVYPEQGIFSYGHHALVQAITADTHSDMFDVINRTDGLVILSSENLARLTRTQISRLARVSGLDSIKVIFYIRNFITLPYSWWQEEVKNKHSFRFNHYLVNLFTSTIPDYPFNANEILNKFASVFGKNSIEAYLYDDVMADFGDVAQHFFAEVLKISDLSPLSFERMNISLPLHVIECIRRLNRMGLDGQREYSPWRQSKIIGEFAELCLAYTHEINFSYLNPFFGSLERDLGRWKSRILNYNPHNKNLFELRNITVNCLNDDIWLHDLDFSQRFQEFLNLVFKSYCESVATQNH